MVPISVLEMPEFIRRAEDLLSEEERLELISHLASCPERGSVMEGTGGVRKLRWVSQGRGKRGGSRVIYYFHNEAVPLFLLTIFPKNERGDLSKEEKNQLKRLIPKLVNTYREGREKQLAIARRDGL